VVRSKLKVDFNFRSASALLLAAILAACGSSRDDPSSRDGSDAQRLSAIVDYMGSDYAGAVRNGEIISRSEYEEQQRFAADARRLGGEIVGASTREQDPLLRELSRLEGLVGAKASPAAVAEAARETRELIVTRFHPPAAPPERPSLARAEASYREDCAVCHGATGDADTERASALDPRPTRFRDPARLEKLSPYRVFNALTFGVRGTSMPSFELLSPVERWDLAFYVMRLGHGSEDDGDAQGIALADAARSSDAELLDRFRAEGRAEPTACVAYVRRVAPFLAPNVEADLGHARKLVHEAAAAFEQGRKTVADRLALDAYLQGFEPLEGALRARDPSRVDRVEAAFRDFRASMAKGEVVETVARGAALEGLLTQTQERRGAVVPFTAAALIFFREGIEAALLIGALLAAARRLGRHDAALFIHCGWVLALPAGVATWWVLDRAVSLGADRRELMEAVVALMAAAVLFSVSFWMISKAESRRWLDTLKRQLERGVHRRSLLVLAGLSFLALYREAAETILFTQALMLESGSRGEVWAGAAAGILGVAATAFLTSRAALRLPLGPFFGVSGVLLCGLAVSFAGSGMHILVASGYLPPRPVAFPAVPWMGIHPDLSGLLVQFLIVATVAGGALTTILRSQASAHGASR